MSISLPTPVHLYVKTHLKSGIKYFGRTTADPFTYPGSGGAWKRLLTKEPGEVLTEIYGTFTDETLLTSAARDFSIANNIVKSPKWANKRQETGVIPVARNPIPIINATTEMWFASYSEASLFYLADPRNLGRAVKVGTQRWVGDFWILESALDSILNDHGSLKNYVAFIEEKTDIQKRRGGYTELAHGKNQRAVKCLLTGEIFANASVAAATYGLTRGQVYNSAVRAQNTNKKNVTLTDKAELQWRWVEN